MVPPASREVIMSANITRVAAFFALNAALITVLAAPYLSIH